MRNRFENAVSIQQGACNPSGIARSLVEACDEARKETASTDAVCNDPAVRLIVHQLAFLMNIAEIDRGSDLDVYSKLTAECEQRAKQAA